MDEDYSPPFDRLWVVLWFVLIGGVCVYLGVKGTDPIGRALVLTLGAALLAVAAGLYRMSDAARRIGGVLCILIVVAGVVQLVVLGSSTNRWVRTLCAVWASFYLLSPSTARQFASTRGKPQTLMQFVPIATYGIAMGVAFAVAWAFGAPRWMSLTACLAAGGAYAALGEDRFHRYVAGLSWIDDVLDAIERHGHLAAFLAKSREPERFDALGRDDCKKVLARLDRLAKSPPAERGASDPFGAIAGLLMQPGLPVDLSGVAVTLSEVPLDQGERRADLYRVLGRLQTRDSLDMLMRHVVQLPTDPAHAEVWSALIGVERSPGHREILFPRLATLLGRADCAAHVMRIANAFKEPPHPLADRASEAAAWLAPDAEAGTRSAAVWTVGLMGYKPAAGALAALLDHEDGQLPVEAAQALVRLGDPRGTAAISKLCADPRRRWRAIAYVKEMDRADLVPPELRTPLVEAEDSLRQWLEHPNEYGKPPDEVELLDSSRRRWPGKGIVDCWLFRYRYGEEWDVGMAGPVTFALMGDKLADKPIVQIYGAYEAWDQNPKRGGPALQELAQKVLEESQEDPPRS